MAKTYTNPGPINFHTVIKRNGEADNSSAFVEFPYDLKKTYNVGNLIPIKATFDGRVVYHGSLAKMGGPCAMLLLRKDIRSELGKQPGEEVDVLVELEDQPRQLHVPQDAQKALTDNGLLDIFNALAYTHRREYVRWIEEAKKPETRSNRIEIMCNMIASGKKSR